ncbi:TIGR03936 family radical SAM-associated protein [Clostridium niameyense]|uniref:TIGR03936 family radical SAM-associated protein n=1 Tax=Clostridium niameyense TaxID=1622073 RepID=UPI00067F0705|nr:TIGR03936 family radical SAM-associated protein [Clostridium niameyense]
MKVRYLIKFSKEGNIKFISHLDLQRTLQRNFKRSGLKVEYSKGFNPHIIMSMAQPLAVGMYSRGEYLDVSFIEETDEKEIINKLNETSPSGIKYFKAVKLREASKSKQFKSMAAVAAAEYVIKIKYDDISNLDCEIKKMFSKDTLKTMKKTKKTCKEVDIKPMIKSFNYSIEKPYIVIRTLINCGSVSNLSAELLATFIKENTTSVRENSFVDIERQETYGEYNGGLVPLYKYAENF